MNQRKLLYIIVLALPLTYLLSRVAGMFFSHEQPFAVLGFEPLIPHEIDNSFPSDHTALTAALSTAVFLSNQKLGIVLWALTLGIGLMRMFAGLHWSVDIMVGAALGAIAVLVSERILRLFSPRIQ